MLSRRPVRCGRVAIRRLNRAEYNNTIRDLIGLDLRPADEFPSDDVGYGFDNIGDVLSTPPVLLESDRAAIGVSDSGMIAVQGIKAGDVVADSSFEKLQNGSKITISKVKLPSTSSDESTAP